MATSSSSSESSGFSALIIVSLVLTLIVAIVTAVYLSGAGDEVTEWIAKKYFRAAAKAEEKALEKAGSDKAQSFLKGTFPSRIRFSLP